MPSCYLFIYLFTYYVILHIIVIFGEIFYPIRVNLTLTIKIIHRFLIQYNTIGLQTSFHVDLKAY